jgi:mannose-1-phosphate guanylyltransferase
MAGGIGSRFWPQSRVTCPKQFVDFFGMGKSLLRQTYERFSRIVPIQNIIVSTNSDYTELVRQQLPELPNEQILREPTHRGTAPSMAFITIHTIANPIDERNDAQNGIAVSFLNSNFFSFI